MAKGSRGGRRAGGNSSSGTAANSATTPSGITYTQFMAMSDSEKFQTMDDIISNPNIQVPDYLDDSVTSKVMYGLGMNGKPRVVSDSELDNIDGTELFRTVYEKGTIPPPSSDGILDQIRNGDYTQMSGSGGSALGRAIYFADDFVESALYGDAEKNAMVMRAKVNKNAKIADYDTLQKAMVNDSAFTEYRHKYRMSSSKYKDSVSLYAIAKGYDGWNRRHNYMLLNRSALTVSSQNKRINTQGNDKDWHQVDVFDWQSAPNVE